MTRKLHMSLNIAGFLRNHEGKNIDGYFDDDVTGLPASDAAAREYLQECLAKGWRVIPMGDCDNFDYQEGCKGHIKEQPPHNIITALIKGEGEADQ